MPTRKQRKRREKIQRHEWEYETTTEEGEVVRASSVRELVGGGKERSGKARADVVKDARGRAIPVPSWQRTLKRAAIFGPILIVLIFLTAPNASTVAKILNAVVLLAIFIPFSHLVDRLVYRSVLKRQQRKLDQERGAGRRGR